MLNCQIWISYELNGKNEMNDKLYKLKMIDNIESNNIATNDEMTNNVEINEKTNNEYLDL